MILNEDKVVKFGGKTYPSDGWCVIVVGGPGSGKSTVLNNLITINGRTFNVDELKEYAVNKKYGDVVDGKLIFMGKEYPIPDDIPEPFNLNNQKYVSFLHDVLRPFNKKIKQKIFGVNGGRSMTSDRLPNVIFDITGSEIDDYEEIVASLKPMGYKISVVYVFETVEVALKNNESRVRHIDRKLLVDKHRDVLNTMFTLATQRDDISSKIDEFWIVMPLEVRCNLKIGKEKYKYIKADNVEQLSLKELFDLASKGEESSFIKMVIDNVNNILKNYDSLIKNSDDISTDDAKQMFKDMV